MMILKKGLLFWGGENFIKTWNMVENPGENSLDAMRNLDRILRWMRADLGHDDSTIEEGDLSDFLLVAKDRGQLKNEPHS